MKSLIRLLIIVGFFFAILLPESASAQTGSYTSGFQILNLDQSNPANIIITFYDKAGAVIASPSDTINAGASKTYFPLGDVPSGFNGSVIISSSTEVRAIVNVLNDTYQGGASYGGFSSGATLVNLPLVMKDNYGISTWFNVMNTTSTAENITVEFAGVSCDQTVNVPANSSHTFDQATDTCLSAGYVGAATVTSTADVVVSVMQIVEGSNSLLAYNGFVSESTMPVMPLVTSNFYNSGTGIQIQNTGSSSTDVTVSYSPSAGFPGAPCTETKTIPANNSVTFGFPQLPVACGTGGTGVTDVTNGGFVGSAKVTGNSASEPLVAIVNQVTRGAAASAAYGAFNVSDGSAKISMPLIMDFNYNLFTGFAIMNVGTDEVNVTCTFSGSTHTETATLASGVSFAAVQYNSPLGTGYVGSALCEATGPGETKIVGIVNQNLYGASKSQDQLLVYEAFPFSD